MATLDTWLQVSTLIRGCIEDGFHAGSWWIENHITADRRKGVGMETLGLVHEIVDTEGVSAEVLATAALAEEMRTANLLALAATIDSRFGGMLTVTGARGVTSTPLVVEAARRMGLALPR